MKGGAHIGAIHATAEAMGALLHSHHGLACRLLMPTVVKNNLFAAPTATSG